jgi:hypothetical protein
MRCNKMKIATPLFSLFLIVSTGCAQVIQTQRVERYETLEGKIYITYLYSSGPAERFRAVLLKDPDSDIDIVPFSVQISKVSRSFKDALSFMQGSRFYKRIDVKRVSYQGRPIGYLITQPTRHGPYSAGSIEVNLFYRDGKVFFAVDEDISYDAKY